MNSLRLPLLLATAGALALTACAQSTATGTGPGNPNRVSTGAMIGAAAGALAGATQGDDTNDRLRNAAIGATIGGGAGAVTGGFLERQAQELRAQLGEGIIIQNTGDALVVRMPQDILFATDSATLSPSIYGDLRLLASSLNQYSASRIEVQGHTDNTGTAAYNQELSERRAQSVTSVLIQNGVSPSRLRSVGYGESQPIASNLDPSGRAQNRRVQVVIRPYEQAR